MYKIVLPIILSINIFAQTTDGKFTLEDAINLSQKASFEEKNIKEDINIDKLSLKELGDKYTPNIYLDAQLGRENNLGDAVGDSFGYIVWKNNLLDKSKDIISDQFKSDIQNKKLILKYAMEKRKIDVMKAFLDGVLADYYQQYTLEQLAMDAIKSNDAKDYYPTGKVSDVTILETQTTMLFSSASKAKADDQQYITRVKLANLLETDLNSVFYLKKPNLKSYWKKELKEPEELFSIAVQNDLILKSMTQELTQMNHKISQIKDNFDYNVNSTVMYGPERQKTIDENDMRWEARVSLQVPLYDSHNTSNKVAKLQIERNKQINKIEQYKSALKEKIARLSLHLKNVKKLHTAYSKQLEYRSLYLDRARINYELDRKSNIGDSMAMYTKAEYEYAQNEYDFVVTYELLQLIIGEKI